MWTDVIGSGYAEEAGCSANTKGMPSYGKGMKHFHLVSNKHHSNKVCVILYNFVISWPEEIITLQNDQVAVGSIVGK
jgi:hypothetical protein